MRILFPRQPAATLLDSIMYWAFVVVLCLLTVTVIQIVYEIIVAVCGCCYDALEPIRQRIDVALAERAASSRRLRRRVSSR